MRLLRLPQLRTIAPVCHRLVCQHLKSAHLQKGGADPSLPHVRRAERQLDTGPTLVCLPCIADAPTVEATPSEDSAESNNFGLDVSIDEIGGGNPKMCYVNYKRMLLKRQRGPLSHDASKQSQAAANEAYDNDPAMQARWKPFLLISR